MRPVRLAHGEDDQRQRQEGGNDGKPEHGREVVCRPPHQGNGEQGAHEGADRVERLAQPKTRAAQIGRREICHQRVTGRAANALADPVDETRRHQPGDGWRQRKHRPGDGRQAVAGGREPFALAEPVRECAGEYLCDGGGRLGDAFDNTDRYHRRAKHRNQVDRQQGVDHLRRDIHQHRDETENPYPRWNIPDRIGRPGASSHVVLLCYRANSRRHASTKTSAPVTMSASAVFSVQWCEMPPIEGTNSMPAGITVARIWAS